jgi:gas vesicle protein
VLLGTAIGAVVGLLATPMSGQDLRGMLKKRAADAGRDIPDRIRDVPGAFRDVPKRGRQLLSDLPESGRRQLSRIPGFKKARRDPERPIDTTATNVTGQHDPSDDVGA